MSNQAYTMYNEGYINAEFMVAYLEWLREQCYLDKEHPLYFVLDNAKYQHCEYMKNCAKQLNSTLEFLPSYSPTINLIERLWRYLKKLLGKQYHDSKAAFKRAVVELLDALGDEVHQEKLWTLMNPVFQRYEKAQILRC